jgi:hypothetical protein
MGTGSGVFGRHGNARDGQELERLERTWRRLISKIAGARALRLTGFVDN